MEGLLSVVSLDGVVMAGALRRGVKNGLALPKALDHPNALLRTLFAAAKEAEKSKESSKSSRSELAITKAAAPSTLKKKARSLVDMIFNPFNRTKGFKEMMHPVDSLFQDPFLLGLDLQAAGIRLPWEVREDSDAFRLRVDMPGLSKDEVHVYVEGRCLVVRGEPDEEKEQKWGWTGFGNYETRVLLPDNVKVEDISAELKDGVLYVSVPKEEADVKTVEVPVK